MIRNKHGVQTCGATFADMQILVKDSSQNDTDAVLECILITHLTMNVSFEEARIIDNFQLIGDFSTIIRLVRRD